MALTRVARPPPLDARLHLPFVTSTHRPILGVTFAAESALVLPLLAGLHRYHTTRVASLLQHSHIYSPPTLTMIFFTPVLSSMMSPLSRAFIITSSKYRTLFAPHVTLPFLASIRIHSASSPFERPAHLIVPNAICTTWFDISYIALVSPVALIYYHHRLPKHSVLRPFFG